MARCSSVLLTLAAAAALVGYASIAAWLEPLPRALLPAALLWLLWQRGRGGVVQAPLALFLALGLFAYFLLTVPRQGIVAPSVGFITSLLALRMVSEKSSRHYLQICALSIFLLAASSLYSLSPLFILYLFMQLLLVTMLLLLLTFSHYSDDMLLEPSLLKRLLAAAISMQVCAAPMIVLLFMVLPRTQIPLWRFGSPVEATRIGFSETVRPGAVANVTAERIPVFRAEMPRQPDERLYWRGTVLNRVKGSTWTRVPPPPVRSAPGNRERTILQRIQLEPGAGTFLFALDAPVAVRLVRASLQPDGVVQLMTPLSRRLRYEALSVRGRSVPEEHPDFYRQLPQAVSPRLRALADGVRRDAATAGERSQLLEKRFRSLGLMYDVNNLPTNADPIDTFLFSGKRGNCEFFAASYALLLRLAGVPARLVGGYYGGIYNDVGGYYLVTQDMAHAWVEYYLEGEGWQRVDPTLWGEGFAGIVGARSRGNLAMVRLYADTLTFFWDSRVIPFDLESQYQVLQQATGFVEGLPRAMRSASPVRLASLLFLTVAAAAAVLLARRRLGKGGRARRLLQRFERRLLQRNPQLPPLRHRGLFSFAEASGNPTARRFALRYGQLVYRDTPLSARDLDELERMVDEL
jgi:transglutaminase-like putative cysteine protease